MTVCDVAGAGFVWRFSSVSLEFCVCSESTCRPGCVSRGVRELSGLPGAREDGEALMGKWASALSPPLESSLKGLER